MSSKTASSAKTEKPIVRSAAWRISLWATVAFVCGTMLVFIFLHHFVANDIQRRSDAWLSGEVDVLGDVAARTPKDALYDQVVEEVAELASREVPNRLLTEDARNDSVFFLQTGADGAMKLWVGAGSGEARLSAIQHSKILQDTPFDVLVAGTSIPFRVATLRMQDGSHIYLGLSERDELRVLRSLRVRFLLLWFLVVLFGFGIVFYATRRMLGAVSGITEAASHIGQSDLSSRVPVSDRQDEVAHLASTLNHMLDRIETSMHQLHTMTDSLAHDLRSPLTAIRGQLETSLSTATRTEQIDPIVSAIEELDRLTECLNKSLDVAEARADALRLKRTELDLDELLRVMVDLYEPCMSDKGLKLRLQSNGSAMLSADAALIHRMIANLLDNELKHVHPSCTVTISLRSEDGQVLLRVEDDGPGFGPEIQDHLFSRRMKGANSSGHGLGMAFIEAVVHAHGGTISAANRAEGGVRIEIQLPQTSVSNPAQPLVLVAA
jgi:signal transduction histidine kinase